MAIYRSILILLVTSLSTFGQARSPAWATVVAHTNTTTGFITPTNLNIYLANVASNAAWKATNSWPWVPASGFGIATNAGTGYNNTFTNLTAVPDAGGSNSATFTSNVVVNGKVSIGTNNPQVKLHVVALSANSDPAIRMSNDAQSWETRVTGSGADQWGLWDITGADTTETIGASVSGVVWIPGGLHSTNIIGTTVLGTAAGANGQCTNGTAIGYYAGYYSSNANQSTWIGNVAGYNSDKCYESSGSGYYSFLQSTNCYYSAGYGFRALNLASNCWGALANGYSAFRQAYNCYRSIALGYYAGYLASNCYNSIFIGPYVGTNFTRPNTLIIDAMYRGTNGLLYGEFDNARLVVNSNLLVAGNAVFPTNALSSTNSIDLYMRHRTLIASGTVSISNVLNAAAAEVRTATLLINANGSDRILRVPDSWRTDDGLRTWTVTNGTLRRITVECWGNLYTNLVENKSLY